MIMKKFKTKTLFIVSCGKYRIRTYGTVARTLDFESSPINHSGNFPYCILSYNFLVAHKGFEPLILRMRISRPGPTRRMRHYFLVSVCKITSKNRTTKEILYFFCIFVKKRGRMTDIFDYYTDEERLILSSCRLCPHECGTNRLNNELGFCKLNANINIALVCNHLGEEPVIVGQKGVCNVFFSHCNCQCIYCQNMAISDNKAMVINNFESVRTLIDKIESTLQQSENVIGFVSPTPHIPQMKVIIRELNKRNLYPKVVYNSSGYDRVEVLRKLEGIVDVFLPDFKYAYNESGWLFSGIKNYKDICLQAIKEMYRQKGSSILTDREEKIESALIIRHLILPQHVQESKQVLKIIAEELSTSVAISLMGQYHPCTHNIKHEELNRTLTMQEYKEVEEYFYSLGFYKGWLQDINSNDNYLPDFKRGIFK